MKKILILLFLCHLLFCRSSANNQEIIENKNIQVIIDGEKMKVWQAELTDIDNDSYKPGEIVKANSKDGLLIKTGDGIIELTEIQMPNLKRMTAKEYLRGHKINF